MLIQDNITVNQLSYFKRDMRYYRKTLHRFYCTNFLLNFFCQTGFIIVVSSTLDNHNTVTSNILNVKYVILGLHTRIK